MHFDFTEENIRLLFGHEAAEDEEPDRLRKYYFKSTIYNQMVADLPIRLLVGHKGIGKSALFRVAISEDQERRIPTIIIQPNDITNIAIDETDFLQLIHRWTNGLSKILARKTLRELGLRKIGITGLENYDYNVIEFLLDTVADHVESIQGPKREIAIGFLDKPELAVYLDDLDRGWEGRKRDVMRISALLNAVRDLTRTNRGMRVKLALRSDVYFLVRTSDESTDKIEGSVIWYSWTNHEIFALLVKRIEAFFDRPVDEEDLVSRKPAELAQYLAPIMQSHFTGKGHWKRAPMYRVLMSLTRKRPRDLVKLCTLAGRQAYSRGGGQIQTTDLESVFQRYSTDRVQDTINEYKSEMPNIEALIMNMRPYRKEREAKKGYVYTTAELVGKIKTIQQNHPLTFADATRSPDPKTIAQFLYKINFLTARREVSDGIIRSYFEENRYLASTIVDFGFSWEVHPAYRWALQPQDVYEIFDSLELGLLETES